MLEARIETFHPVRWTIIAGVLIPAALVLVFALARVSGANAERYSRLLRYVVFAEMGLLVITAAVGYVYEHRARDRDAQIYKPPGRLIDVGGYRLHLNCTGSGGPTVVLEYGLEGSYLDWHKVQPEIARFARVCSYDRAGYGWSDSSPKPRVPSVMADELHALLRASGEKAPYIVVAHSYGSLIGQMFAHKFPEEISALVLVDGVVLGPLSKLRLDHALWLRAMQLTSPIGLPRWRRWCAAGPAELQESSIAANCRSRVYGAYYGEWSQMPESRREMQGLTSLGKVPLIVITRDPALGHDRSEAAGHFEQQKEMLKLSSDARLIVAEGSGHDVPGMRPDVIVEAVRSLITTSPAPEGSRGTP